MTLIQTVFTKDKVIQVSDRRLTSGDNLIDDYYTKLVVWNDQFTVGFTGLARVDRNQKQSTARWIADILADCPVIEIALHSLKTEAEKRFKKLPKNWDRRLTIVLAGFDPRKPDGPMVASVTNMDPQTNISADASVFETYTITPPPGNEAGVYVVGASMNEQQKLLSTRYLRRELKKGDGVNQAVRLMVGIQRDVAKTDKKKTVGPDALCVHIPRGSQQNMPVAVSSNLGGPDLPTGGCSFGYFDRAGWQWKQEAPLFAGGGFVKKFFASADPNNPDNQSVGVQFLKVPPQWQSS